MKSTKRFLSLLLIFILLVSTVALTSCKKINRAPASASAENSNANYISNVEIKDGSIFVTYSNDPNNPVKIGDFGFDGETASDSSLKFFPLPSGTYGVTAGNAKYLEEITIPEKAVVISSSDVIATDMRKLPNQEEGVKSFVQSGVCYTYLYGKLLSVAWVDNGIRYTISGDLDICSLDSSSALSKLLKLESAGDAIASVKRPTK